MTRITGVRMVATGVAAVVAAGVGGAPAGAAVRDDEYLRDSLYLLPLGPVRATPECLFLVCPLVEPFAPVGSGPDAGTTGLRATGVPLAPNRVAAEARSEPLPYEGAGGKGTLSVAFSADRLGEGTGSAVTSVTLEEAGGPTVAELPATALPLDGRRATVGPVAIDPARLVVGRSYVAVARFALSAPAGSSVTARVFAPKLLALGPKRAPKTSAGVRPKAPVTRLRGRRLHVTAVCPRGSFRCEVQIRAALDGRTLRKGSIDLQAAARHTFTYRLSAAELRRARRAGRITTALRLVTEAGRVGTSRSTFRVPRR